MENQVTYGGILRVGAKKIGFKIVALKFGWIHMSKIIGWGAWSNAGECQQYFFKRFLYEDN